MSNPVIAVIVGSSRQDSINARLARALTRMAEDRLTFRSIAIDALPLFNQDLIAADGTVDDEGLRTLLESFMGRFVELMSSCSS